MLLCASLGNQKTHNLILPLDPPRSVGALMTLIVFTLSNARRFYSSMGNPLDMKGLTHKMQAITKNNMLDISILLIHETRFLYQ